MKKPLLAILLCGMIPYMVWAQSDDYRMQGYAYTGVGLPSPEGVGLVKIGGGVDGLVHKGLGVGIELGYTSFPNLNGIFEEGTVNLSPNLSYHFLSQSKIQKHDPFISAGPTLYIFPGRTAAGANFSVGMNYWFSEHVGIRFEARTNILPENRPSDFVARYNVGFQIGMSFR